MKNCKKIVIQDIEIANNLPLVLIAGPCQLESREHALEMASSIKTITEDLGIKFIFKSSFDKANRTSIDGKRGIGLEASMPIFAEIKEKFHCPILTDVHNEKQCESIGSVIDILQIPAFLCRQTDLLLAAGKTGKVVNVKKGQFLAPWNMEKVAQKIASTGNDQVMLTERGFTFGYNNLINDMRALPIMSKTGYPVVFDATHSVQQPGAQGSSSGGEREFILPLAKAATSVGIAAIFVETHQDPNNAPSDGSCMLPLDQLQGFLKQIILFDELAKKLSYE